MKDAPRKKKGRDPMTAPIGDGGAHKARKALKTRADRLREAEEEALGITRKRR